MIDPARHDFRFSVRTRHPRRKGLTLAQRAGRAAGTWEMIGNVLPGDDLKVAQEIQRLDFEANQLKRKIAKNKQDAIDFTTDSIDAIPDPAGFDPSDVFGAGQTAEDTWAASASEHTIAHIANVATEFVADGVAAGYKLQARLVAKWFRVQTMRIHRASDSALIGSWTLDWANNVYTQSVFTAWIDLGETADGTYYITGEGNHVGDNFVKEMVVDIRWVPTGYPAIDYNAPAASAIANTPAGTISSTDVQAALNELDTEKAPLATPIFTGSPLAPTQAAGNNSTRIATTAYVQTELGSYTTTAGLTTLLTAKADLASPALTGNPTAPTQTAGNNSTRIATTAYVQTELGSYTTTAGLTTLLAAKADLASPALTGNPTAPTQTAGNNSTRVATTAFVKAAVDVGPGKEIDFVSSSSNVSTTNTSEGTADVVLTGADVVYDGSTTVDIHFNAGYGRVNSGTGSMRVSLYESTNGGGAYSLVAALGRLECSVAGWGQFLAFMKRLTPSAATRRYQIRIWTDTGGTTSTIYGSLYDITLQVVRAS